MTREIVIKPVLNGWLCVVGCQSVVFNSKTELLGELGKYFDAPEETEKRYMRDAVNRIEPQPAQPAPTPPEATRPMTMGCISTPPDRARMDIAGEPHVAAR